MIIFLFIINVSTNVVQQVDCRQACVIIDPSINFSSRSINWYSLPSGVPGPPKNVLCLDMPHEWRTIFKRNFHRFCERTSLHGFEAIWNAKTWIWRILWILICAAAFVLTTYQVYETVQQYFTQDTNTVITTAEENEILYPWIGLCYWHWIYWVDWQKVRVLNSNKEAMIYSLTFFNTMFSTKEFNVNAAREKFQKILTENNISTVFEFYNKISKEVPINDGSTLKPFFDKTNIIYKDPDMFFCYEVSSQSLFDYFNNDNRTTSQQKRNKTISFSTYDQKFADLNGLVNFAEFDHYMRRWIEQKTTYKIKPNSSNESLINFVIPVVLFVNGYTEPGIQIMAENNAYFIDITGVAFQWLNKEHLGPENAASFSHNDTCETMCIAQRWAKSQCTCQYLEDAIRTKTDQPSQVCRKQVRFISTGVEVVSNSTDKNIWQKRICPVDSTNFYDKCINDCVDPFKMWKYTVGVSVTTMPSMVRNIGLKKETKIIIEYPLGKDIIVMVEVDAQSWENFIGSVGGLLGIWTGASILSFIELFYLCCFADCEDVKFWRSKDKAQVFKKTVVEELPKKTVPAELLDSKILKKSFAGATFNNDNVVLTSRKNLLTCS